MFLTRLCLKLAFIPILVFTAMIGLIRSQRYDDSELRAFLTPPEGCPAPCFMGIRPGVTTVEEFENLSDIPLVQGLHLNLYNAESLSGQISWDWAEEKSKFLAQGGTIFINGGMVYRVYIPSNIKFGDLWLLLGKPEKIAPRGHESLYYHTAVYPSNQIVFVSRHLCPELTPQKFWFTKMDIELEIRQTEYDIDYHLPYWKCHINLSQ